ncbi:MAG: AAA family ATPase [Sporichthyaceae bacterium]
MGTHPVTGPAPPLRGVLTFLFTDLVDSTGHLAALGEDRGEVLRREHLGLLREQIGRCGGTEVKNLGDGLMVVFASAVDAVGAALAIQEAIAVRNRDAQRPFAVRVGLQTGEPTSDGADYFGTPVVVAKRLCDRAAGGQVLAGGVLAGLVGVRDGIRFRDLGSLVLKGLPNPVPVVAVEPSGAAAPVAPRPREPRVARAPRPAPRASFVARARELAALTEDLARAHAEGLRVVVVGGDAGVGKSRLVAEFAERAPRTVLRLRARGHPLGAAAAYGLWVDALEPVLAAMTEAEVLEVCGPYLDDLATVLRAAAAVRGSVAPTDGTVRPADAFAGTIAGLARRSPLLLVLDDAHLADPSSWETLRRLSRLHPTAPVLVVATLRREPGEPAAEVAEHLALELEQDGLLRRLEVEPLDRTGIGELAAALLDREPPAALVAWLMERSQGNPLFASGLLRALVDSGGDVTAPALSRVPVGLAERVSARVGKLPGEQRELVELLAVAGRPLSLDELGALTGRGASGLAADLDALVAGRALLEEERGRDLVYLFAHGLVRDAVHQEIGAARRRVMHRQVGRVLAATGAVAEAARHLARAAGPGDPEAVDTLLVAIRQAESRQAYREALELLAELVELLPAGDGRWTAVYEAMNWDADWVVEHRAGIYAVLGIRALREIDAVFDATDAAPDRRARVKFRLASFLSWGVGDMVAARAEALAAATLFAQVGDLVGELLATREAAWALGLGGDLSGQREAMARVLERARAADLPLVALQAHHGLAFACVQQGRLLAGIEQLEVASDIAAREGRRYRGTTVAMLRACAEASRGLANEGLSRLVAARAADPDYRDTSLLEALAFACYEVGDVNGALEAARESLAWNARGIALRKEFGMTCGAAAAIAADRPDEARVFLSRIAELSPGMGFGAHRQLVRVARSLVDWHAGRPGDGVATALAAVRGLDEVGYAGWPAAFADCLEIAAAAADRGALVECAALVERASTVEDNPVYAGLTAWARGTLALHDGDRENAAECARQGVAALRTTGSRGHLARALHLLGRAESDRSAARAALEEAAAIYGAVGAVWHQQRVAADLRTLGSAGRRAAAAVAGAGALSRREREVAALAARGASARDIAEELFIGERTVESHLANAYAKLGVASKLDLARRARELGLVVDSAT